MNVLVAPLDWGLGHATRCVPLIEAMLQLGWKVTLAGEGASIKLLTREFPDVTTLALKGYRIRYPKQGVLLIPKLMAQLPKIAQTIRAERAWLKQAQKENQWDLVISDNRYGLAIPETKCIFISHQLRVLSGWGSFIDTLLNKQLHRWIKQFSECWIPDEKENGGIAGILSHPPTPYSLLPTTYIGPLSRLKPQIGNQHKHILVLLSGPEPQRTLFEEKIIQQISNLNYQFLVVRGLPNSTDKPANTKHIQFENHLSASDLSTALVTTQLVICRSGYSSIMDLLKLRKKGILIPTPGQTEQLYLAQVLGEKNWFKIGQQADFQLDKLIPECQQNKQVIPVLNFDLHKQVLAELVTQ